MRDVIEGMGSQSLDGHNITVNEAQSHNGEGDSGGSRERCNDGYADADMTIGYGDDAGGSCYAREGGGVEGNRRN